MKKRTKERVKRQATAFEAFFALFAMVFLLAIGTTVFKLNLQVMMMCSAIICMLIAWRLGLSYHEIMEIFAKKYYNMLPMLPIGFGIGLVSSAWMVSGTAPVLVVWLAKLVSPKYVLVLSFLLVALLSTLTGTSFGSMGTLGIVMFSISLVQGIPAGLAAAASICGAFFGAYISPVADMVNLAAVVNKRETFDIVKGNLLPIGVSTLLTTAFFYILGLRYSTGGAIQSLDGVKALSAEIESIFPYTGWAIILPLVICVGMFLFKLPATVALYASGASSMLIAIFLQHFSFAQVMESVWTGFSTATMVQGEVSEIVSTLLNRGGILYMAAGTLFLIFSTATIAYLEYFGTFERLLTVLIGKAEKKTNIRKLNLVTTLFAFAFTAAAGDGNPAILLSSSAFHDRYVDAGYDPVNIGRMSLNAHNAGMMYFPWCYCAWFAGFIYEVEVFAYAPYAVLFWIVPVVTLILSYLGIGNVKLAQPQAACAKAEVK